MQNGHKLQWAEGMCLTHF